MGPEEVPAAALQDRPWAGALEAPCWGDLACAAGLEEGNPAAWAAGSSRAAGLEVALGWELLAADLALAEGPETAAEAQEISRYFK